MLPLFNRVIIRITLLLFDRGYLVSVHNVRLLRYARQKNAHLPHVNSAFFDFASLASEHHDPDTDFIDRF